MAPASIIGQKTAQRSETVVRAHLFMHATRFDVVFVLQWSVWLPYFAAVSYETFTDIGCSRSFRSRPHAVLKRNENARMLVSVTIFRRYSLLAMSE